MVISIVPHKAVRGLVLFVLVMISACLSSAAHAQPATNLSISVQSWTAHLPSGAANFNLYPSNNACSFGDANSDSAADIICINQGSGNGSPSSTATLPSSAIILESTKSSTNGFTGSSALGNISADSAGNASACAVADFDGDGRSDLACFYLQSTGNAQGSPTVWFSGSSPFNSPPVNDSTTAVPTSSNGTYFNGGGITPFGSSCTVGHFMAGVGQQILCNYPRTTTYYLWRFQAVYSASGAETPTETGGGSAMLPGPAHTGTYASFGSNCLTGDFNGDGLTDVACPNGSGTAWNMGLSSGTGFVDSTWTINQGSATDCATGDFNGDGKADLICYTDSTSTLTVFLSTGASFDAPQNWSFSGMPPAQNPDGTTPRDNSVFSTVCSLADLNGDGKTDLMCYSNNSGNSTDWVYALSTGAAFTVGHLAFIKPPNALAPSNYSTSTIAEPFAGPCTLGDFVGTGLADILCYTNTPNGTGSLTPFQIGVISRQ